MLRRQAPRERGFLLGRVSRRFAYHEDGRDEALFGGENGRITGIGQGLRLRERIRASFGRKGKKRGRRESAMSRGWDGAG